MLPLVRQPLLLHAPKVVAKMRSNAPDIYAALVRLDADIDSWIVSRAALFSCCMVW